MKPAPKDPFDYKLRSKEEVMEEFKYYEEPFDIQAEFTKYTAGDTRMEDNLDTRDRVAKITVNLTEMGLAPLQRQRLIFLLGNRYQGSDKIKIVCKQYNTWHENFVRANEILRELYWESKRAPDTNTTAQVNPYRRDFFKRKFLGRTREERLANEQEQKRFEEERRLKIDEHYLTLDQDISTKEESGRKKRREYAQRRAALGFNDKGQQEVEDKIMEDLEHKSKEYEKQIEEQKERKPVKMVTPVQGISKKEIEDLMIRDADKFKPIWEVYQI